MRLRVDRAGAGGAALLLALVALAYANALGASFQFDDFQMLVDNPKVHGLAAWWQALPGIRPLLKLSYALNWSLSPAPWGWHAFNLAVHLANAALLLAIARDWQRDLAPPATEAGWAPLATAALFALHPAATEAVTYVSGRSVSLMAMFYLGSWLALRRAEDSAQPWRGRLLAAGLFALALGVRETAITLPAAWLVYARLRRQGWSETGRALRAPLVVLALAAVAALATPGYHAFLGWSLHTRDAGAQLLGQAHAHAYLLAHTALGLRTNIDPDLRVPADLDATVVAAGVVLLGVLGAAWFARHRAPWLAFGLLWYLLQLTPSNSLLPRFDLANDRHLYLALPGLAFALATALARWHRLRAAAPIALAVLALGLAGLTVRRNADYRDELALWQATVRASPGKARPWLNLGYARQLAGDRAGAVDAYRCALRREPGNAQAAVNLGALGVPVRAPTGAEDPCQAGAPPPR